MEIDHESHKFNHQQEGFNLWTVDMERPSVIWVAFYGDAIGPSRRLRDNTMVFTFLDHHQWIKDMAVPENPYHLPL